jgi:hypothetical protein
MDEIQQAREYGDAQRAEGLREGKEAGLREGEGRVLARLAGRRLGRALNDDEAAGLGRKLAALGAEQVEDAVLGLSPAELAAWLADTSAG